ncbi:MAG: 50S ribosomal protein L24 [Spirochaetales bacterium]|nr:50S ribosomal protein L24 [Spirochaetales bacterium]
MTGKANTGTGRIIRIDVVNQKVYVEGQNLVKKAIKQKKQNQKAGISEIEAAIHISNVRIICKKCGPTRIGTKIGADGKKTRICKKCGDEF